MASHDQFPAHLAHDDTGTSAVNRTVARMRPFKESIFATASKMALKTESINLGQGAPDWDGPAVVLDEACRQIQQGNNQYAPGRGIPELREAICADRKRRMNQDWDPKTEVLVTVGATEAIAASILGLVEPGTHAVMIEPYYDSYRACLALANTRHTSVPLLAPDETQDRWHLDIEALSAAIEPDTSLLIINTPHNPTGAILTEEELKAIAEVAIEADAIVVADEVYERLIFPPIAAEHEAEIGIPYPSIANIPGMRDRCVVISSGGKTFNVTGWKTGWALGAPHLIDALLHAKQYLSFVGATPVQPAIAKGLREADEWVAELAATLEDNCETLIAGLEKCGLHVYPPEAGYFVIADISPLGLGNAFDVLPVLAEQAGVVGIPVAAFVDEPQEAPWPNLMRFSFCKRKEVIEEGLARLQKFCTSS